MRGYDQGRGAGACWLAYLPRSNALNFRADRSIGQYRNYAYPFGPMPAIFSTTPNGGVTHWSFYGTLIPQLRAMIRTRSYESG